MSGAEGRLFEAYDQPKISKAQSKRIIFAAIVSIALLAILYYSFTSIPLPAITSNGLAIDQLFLQAKAKTNIQVKNHAKYSYADRRFIASLTKQPEPLKKSLHKLLAKNTSAQLIALQSSRYKKIKGLSFCDILNGAIIDTLVHIHALGGSIAQINPTTASLSALLDAEASRAYNKIFDIYAEVDPGEAKRFACYCVAEGANPTANLSDSRLIVKFDPTSYFSSILPAITTSTSTFSSSGSTFENTTSISKKKFKIAYLVMVKESQGIHQLKMLLENLDDGESIILIHVEARQHVLYTTITDFINERKNSSLHNDRSGNLFMARNRYPMIPNHISLIYSYLSGYFELRDLADWDYVINLSNYDWPLRRNIDIHRILSLNLDACYIDYWVDTGSLYLIVEAMAYRTMRPHLGNKNRDSTFHPPELSITDWPFSFWQSFKQMQWMVLTPSAIDFLRRDRLALNYLALLEHTYMPEETYFATVLFNSRRRSNITIVDDKKRYVRDGADQWIGWKDRTLFPPGTPNPAYLFIRPFNALGDFFGETRLLEWIRVNHLDLSLTPKCKREQLGRRLECLGEIVGDVAVDGEVVIIPVNSALRTLGLNLQCSLSKLGITNYIFWALDVEAHEWFMEEGHLVYYIPSTQIDGTRVEGDVELRRALRHKPAVMLSFLRAGFKVWYLDADMLAVRDFRARGKEIVTRVQADVILSFHPLDRADGLGGDGLKVDAGIMFLRPSDGGILFLESIARALVIDKEIDDQEAVRGFLGTGDVVFTGVGDGVDRADLDNGGRVYPHSSGQIGVGKGSIGLGDAKDSAGSGDDRAKKDERHKGFTISILDYFTSNKKKEGKIKIHYFDELEFISAKNYYGDGHLGLDKVNPFWLIHASGGSEAESLFRSKSLWLLDDQGKCGAIS